MSTKSIRHDEPRPLAGGWEAYRATALAIIEQQERAAKSLPTREARDADRTGR
ncbi:MAG: hypothetical protein ACTHLR_13445 [Rhizomicrobium sp.]